MSTEYEVGYRKPPRHTRFQKGHSGNPRGRPKQAKNLKSDLLEELQERILVREGSTQRQLSKRRAVLKSLTMKAIKGDTRAIALVLNTILRLVEVDDAEEVVAVSLNEDEQAIVASFEERVRRRLKQEAGNDQPTHTPHIKPE